MVSFNCESCNDCIKKPQLDKHRQRCPGPFTCLDCSVCFYNRDYANHTSCISEKEKYEKSVYKAPKGQGKKQQQQKSAPAVKEAEPAQEVESKKRKVEEVEQPKEKKKKVKKEQTNKAILDEFVKEGKEISLKDLYSKLTAGDQVMVKISKKGKPVPNR